MTAPFYSRTVPLRAARDIVAALADNGIWYQWTAKGFARSDLPVTIKVRTERQRRLDQLVDRFDRGPCK